MGAHTQTQTALRMDDELWAALDRACAQRGVTRQHYIREALVTALKFDGTLGEEYQLDPRAGRRMGTRAQWTHGEDSQQAGADPS